MTVACAHQPNYLPWLGTFAKIFRSDVFIILDDVQFPRRSWTNRVRIGTEGNFIWLTVPVQTKGRFQAPINQIRIQNDGDWVNQHLRTLQHVYGKTPHFKTVQETIKPVFEKGHEYLITLNLQLLEAIFNLMGREISIRMASKLGGTEKGSERLADLCARTGAEQYLAGDGAAEYEDTSAYIRREIDFNRLEFRHPDYTQHGNKEFIPGFSILDALFNMGPNATREMLEVSHLNPEGKT